MDESRPLLQIAVTLDRAGRRAEAESIYRDILKRWPAEPNASYCLSTHLLARGEDREGWALYESRTEVPQTGIRKPKASYPEWKGEAVSSLLVFPEQGFGDQIMFARYVPLLRARGVRVTLLCRPELARLFEALDVQVIPASGEVSLPRHDAWCLIGSLPHLVGGAPSGIYLPERAGGVGVGYCASGNPAHVNDANRSMGADARRALEAVGPLVSLHPEDSGAADFQDTAEIIAGLALVLSVDTAVAHLAGAMGKPTWLMLPAAEPEWRWGRDEDHTPLYPSVRLFRQAEPGAWLPLIDRISRDLKVSGLLG